MDLYHKGDSAFYWDSKKNTQKNFLSFTFTFQGPFELSPLSCTEKVTRKPKSHVQIPIVPLTLNNNLVAVLW